MFMLLEAQGTNITASAYAEAARDAGLEIVSWTTERSGRLQPGGGGFFYQTVASAVRNDGDILTVMDALAQEVGIIGLFSDWPATTTFYANCMETTKSRIRTGKTGREEAADT
jgi:glycerophosphoryl diester phosphodiesterase